MENGAHRSFSGRGIVDAYRGSVITNKARARALIAGGRTLAEAAVECGFADQSHLTRAFASHFGFTPGDAARRRVLLYVLQGCWHPWSPVRSGDPRIVVLAELRAPRMRPSPPC